MRIKTFGLLVGLLIMLGGCSDNLMGPEDFNIDGAWSSSLSGASFSVNLSEKKGTVTGNASLRALAFQVSGTRVGAVLVLDFTSSLPIPPFVFSGRIFDKNTIIGTVNGAGFDNRYLVFTRN